MDEIRKYIGWLIKIKYKPNLNYSGLRRSLTYNPYIQQEFSPEDTYYILAGFEFGSTPENLILLCK